MESQAYEELLKRDGRIVTHVVGNSMLPLLHDRQSIVIVEDVRRAPPRRGDVVLYAMGGSYILHRVLRVAPEEYLIRGDNTRALEHVPKAAVLATMTGFYRRPEGRLVSRGAAANRLYRLCLPGIRLARRAKGRAWRAMGKVRRAMAKAASLLSHAMRE